MPKRKETPIFGDKVTYDRKNIYIDKTFLWRISVLSWLVVLTLVK